MCPLWKIFAMSRRTTVCEAPLLGGRIDLVVDAPYQFHSPISLLRRNMYFVGQRLPSASGPERRDENRLAATDTNRINPTIPRTMPTGIL